MTNAGRGLASRRGWLGFGAAAAALLLAAWAVVLAPDGHLAYGVESVSGATSGWLQRPVGAVPRLYAIAAGMVTTLNPCGFALLPAYLGLYLGDRRGEAWPPPHRLRRAAAISLAVTVSFIALFGLVGVAVGFAGRAVTALFPWIGLLVGIVLVIAGGTALAGRPVYSAAGDRMADSLGARARAGGLGGYAAFGLAYALASLGCALPIFLTVVGSALVGDTWLAGLAQLALYGSGMAILLTALTVAVAVFDTALLARLRGFGRVAEPLGAVLLLLVGAYVIYYWLTLGGILG